MWRISDGSVVELLSDPAPATGRGLSGGVHVWHPDGTAVFVVTRTGIVRVDIEHDAPVRTTALPFDPTRSWSTPAVSKDGRSLAAVADWREVHSWNLHDAHDSDAVEVVHAGHDFIIDCDWWGERLMAVAWDRPHMHWTRSTIVGASLGNGPTAQQPRASADGRVRGWIDDSTGLNLLHIDTDGDTAFVDDRHEHAGPTWGPGQRSWCFSPDGSRVAVCRNTDGFGRLEVFRTDDTSAPGVLVSLAVHGCVSWEGDTLVAVRTGARTPSQVVAYDVTDTALATGKFSRSILFDTADPRWKTEFDDVLVEPGVISEDTIDGPVVSRLYAPPHPHGGLIVWVHGGPYDQWQVTWRPRLNFWLSRGWTILVPDHRGSSGHGRAFMLAQEGAWGGVDAVDVLRATMSVHLHLDMYMERTVFMGGSAGGLTALNAARLAQESGARVGGVVVSYPVVDLDAMFDGDDPFETHDMSRLVGPRGDASVARRSPHLNAHELVDVPVLVFHGDLDTSVPIAHSVALVDAVRAAGGTDIELLVMQGEGHGFRNPDNVRREYGATEGFLQRVLPR